MAADVLVAAGTDRSGWPFRLNRAVAPAPEAGPWRAGPATPADRAARGDPLAGPGLPTDRADRRRALVAAIAQVRGGCCRPLGDLAGPPAAPAWPLRSLVARGADLAGIGGPGDGALLAAGRAHAERAHGAELAACAAVGYPCSGAPHPAAPAAFRHDLLVLVITGRADAALGTPGVDPPGLAAASTCFLAVAGRAGAADRPEAVVRRRSAVILPHPAQAGAATVRYPAAIRACANRTSTSGYAAGVVSSAPGYSLSRESISRSARPCPALAAASTPRSGEPPRSTAESPAPPVLASRLTQPTGVSTCSRPDKEPTLRAGSLSGFIHTRRLLHLMQYRSLSAAAAGGTAALADVAAAGRAHLRPAGEAERGVRGPALLELDQLGGGVRAVR
jgi:hypothetical protein